MTNEEIIKVAQECLRYFTTTDLTEDEEQEFLDYYRGQFSEEQEV